MPMHWLRASIAYLVKEAFAFTVRCFKACFRCDLVEFTSELFQHIHDQAFQSWDLRRTPWCAIERCWMDVSSIPGSPVIPMSGLTYGLQYAYIYICIYIYTCISTCA